MIPHTLTSGLCVKTMSDPFQSPSRNNDEDHLTPYQRFQLQQRRERASVQQESLDEPHRLLQPYSSHLSPPHPGDESSATHTYVDPSTLNTPNHTSNYTPSPKKRKKKVQKRRLKSENPNYKKHESPQDHAEQAAEQDGHQDVQHQHKKKRPRRKRPPKMDDQSEINPFPQTPVKEHKTTPYENPPANNDQPADLENPNALHNEKRLFSWCFSKEVPPVTAPEERKSYPWKKANPFSRAMFYWLWPTLMKGYKRTLQPDDLWYLPDNLKVEAMHEKYMNNLEKILTSARDKHLKKHKDLSEFHWPHWAIPWAIYKTFFLQYSMSCTFLALSFCCQALSPLLTRRLIDFVENQYFGIETTYNKGIGYTIGSVILIFVNGLLLNHFFHNAMVTGAQAKSILTKQLLLKSFKLSAKSKFKFPIGRVTSLMTTDLARIDLAIGFQPLIICCPVPVIIAVVLLLTNIGVASLAGIGLFVISLVVCVLLTHKLYLVRQDVVIFTDERISLMREALNNLKIIKFYAWELAYKLKLTKLREKEMKHLFTIKVLRNFITAYAVTLPTLSSMISFVTMWASNRMKSPGEVFSSLSLFSILAQAIMLLPIALATGADAYIGFKRCNDYLNASEFDDNEDETNYKKGSKLVSGKFYVAGDTDLELAFKNDSFVVSNDELSSNEKNETVIQVNNADFIWQTFHDEFEDDNSLWEEEHPAAKKRKQQFASKNKKLNNQVSVHEKAVSFNSRSSTDTYFESMNSISTGGENNNGFPGLTNINLTIKKGEFVVITGVIGSGKSSLLSALAGFMKLSNPGIGSLNISDDLLLCSDPWIQNATVRENILFGKSYNPVKYKKVVHACCLDDDIAMLSAKDHTEIGERGVTLSGGQKARINLARATYADKNILLFDDVLSAVDARVGKHITDNLFYGLLKDKTKVLATHQLSLVENADKIVFLNGDGSIDVGTLSELSYRNRNFRTLTDFYKDSNKPTNDAPFGQINYSNEQIYNTTNPYNEDLYLSREETNAPEPGDLTGRTLEDEDRATNAISWEIYKRYINLGSGIFGYLAVPVFLIIITLATFCQLFTNTWLSWWTEKKFKQLSDHYYVGWYVGFAFLTVFFTAIEFAVLTYMNNRSAELLNVKAVAKVLHAPMSFMDTNPMGRILNRFTKDTDSLDNEIGEQLRLFLFPLALIIGIVILCIIYLPWFAIAVPFLGLMFVFISNFYSGSSREIKRLEALQRSVVYNNFNETLTGMTTIQAYKCEDNFVKKNDHFLNKMNEAYYLAIANQRWLSVHLDIVASLFALIICVLCITQQFNISASSTGLLLNYVIQIVGLLSLTIRSMTQVENEMNSVERLHSYAFHLPQEAQYEIPEQKPPQEWPAAGFIQVKDLSIRYRPNLPLVLKNLNFNIYPGEKVGICGRTGAGKSSIMTALYRLNELETGSIRIDGLDISQMGLYDLRSRLSIIPQDPVLFQGSIRRNLDPFDQYDDDTLWDSLRRADLIDELQLFKMKGIKLDPENNVGLDDLPKFHLDQLVEDDGNNFSLGEKQLLALARALVRNSKILVLDEATSSVDYGTDAKIQETIVNEFTQCTILTIAHRLKTILNYDRILVMDNGSIVEKGTPLELFDKNGVFTNMCEKANIRRDEIVEHLY